MASPSQLAGFTVGVTADRRGAEQALMLSRLGLDVVHGPAIQTLPVADDVRLRAVTESLIEAPPDYVVANTGLGMRSWLAMAASWGLDGPLRDALRSARIAARGPKAAGAVQIAGLPVWWRARDEQLASVGRRLLEEPLAGARVALQLHGDDHQTLTPTLQAAGAVVTEVPVYRWVLPGDARPAERLIEACCAGGIDAVTFTAGPAVRNLFELAGALGRRADLLAALNRSVLVACVGPVCAAVAVEEGLAAPAVPEHWRLGSLVRLVAERLRERRRAFLVGGVHLALQGTAAVVDGDLVRLTDRERAVLARLADQPGGTVTRATLLAEVWQDPDADPHVLETVVTRLRAKLGPAGDGIETAVRRGYRLSATAVDA